MITDKELTEYHSLCSRFARRKEELFKLLEETFARKQDALLILAKANRPIRHLTGRQRQVCGLNYYLSDITARKNQIKPIFAVKKIEEESFPELKAEISVFKPKKPVVLALIDRVKKKLLQLDLLEMRCREIIAAIDKAMQAFFHEWKNIKRKIYPLGIFSHAGRSLRKLTGNTYFSFGEMKEVAALGSITALVLTIIDSPLV